MFSPFSNDVTSHPTKKKFVRAFLSFQGTHRKGGSFFLL
jgi:hypothetical protein